MRERLHVHDERLQARRIGDGDAVFDFFLSRRRDQHFLLFRIVGRRPERLEIEVHFLERERDVLVRFGLDLQLELLFAKARGHHDPFRDDGAGRHGHRHMLRARAQTLVRAAHGIGYGFEVVDVAVNDCVARERLDRIPFDPITALPGVDDLEHLHGRRANVEAEQGGRLGRKQVELHSLFPLYVSRLSRDT